MLCCHGCCQFFSLAFKLFLLSHMRSHVVQRLCLLSDCLQAVDNQQLLQCNGQAPQLHKFIATNSGERVLSDARRTAEHKRRGSDRRAHPGPLPHHCSANLSRTKSQIFNAALNVGRFKWLWFKTVLGSHFGGLVISPPILEPILVVRCSLGIRNFGF